MITWLPCNTLHPRLMPSPFTCALIFATLQCSLTRIQTYKFIAAEQKGPYFPSLLGEVWPSTLTLASLTKSFQ